MIINGTFYSEPELRAKINAMETENAELKKAIEAEPERRGQWNKVMRKNIWDKMTSILECSACKRFAVKGVGITQPSKFCPNCGAKMDGETT